MIDVVHSYSSPIFEHKKFKKLPSSFYYGVLFAVLLHAGLLYYLFSETFTTTIVPDIPAGPITTVFMDHPKPPPLETTQPKPPSNHIVAHKPIMTTPVVVETTPIDPNVEPNKAGLTTSPPIISPVAGGTSTSSASAPPYIKANWARFPDSKALGEYYPARALDNEIEGLATVECTVLDKAGRVSCVALSETPGNYGFGKATVNMVQNKGRIDVTKGDVAMGAKLQATIKWTLGN